MEDSNIVKIERFRRPIWYVLDERKNPKRATLEEYAAWLASKGGEEYRVVDQTKITKEITVSTVFLGVDHNSGDGPPLLWETIIFGLCANGCACNARDFVERYSTFEGAKKGHEKSCKKAKALLGIY